METNLRSQFLTILDDGTNHYYADGLHGKPFAPIPSLTLETSAENLHVMLHEYALTCCKLSQTVRSDPEFVTFFHALYLTARLYALAYLDGLRAAEGATEE